MCIRDRTYDKGPPGGESLKETGERVLPYYLKNIFPLILKNMNILIAAHGNSLRSLIKYLEGISDEDIVKLEIPTGAPIHYSFDEDGNVISKINLKKERCWQQLQYSWGAQQLLKPN